MWAKIVEGVLLLASCLIGVLGAAHLHVPPLLAHPYAEVGIERHGIVPVALREFLQQGFDFGFPGRLLGGKPSGDQATEPGRQHDFFH